jgi:tetratricopeptide (TPR) repeat protein
MRKIGLLFIAVVLITLLTAGEHNENELFMSYQQDHTFENFQKAVEHYNSNYEDVKDNKSVLMLSYLYTMELENNLEILGDNLDSLTTRTKFSYANLLLELGRLDESIAIYDKINEDVPKWSCPWRHKGEALMKMEKLEDAEKATLKAIETKEDHFDAYVQLAYIQKDMKKFKEALKSLNKGLSYYSSDPEEEITDEEIIKLKLELKELLEKK